MKRRKKVVLFDQYPFVSHTGSLNPFSSAELLATIYLESQLTTEPGIEKNLSKPISDRESKMPSHYLAILLMLPFGTSWH